MAAVAHAPSAATALTPPSSSHGNENGWEYSTGEIEQDDVHNKTSATRFDRSLRNPVLPQEHSSVSPSQPNGFDMTARKMRSADNLNSSKWSRSADHGLASPTFGEEARGGKSNSMMKPNNNPELTFDEASSKWIHRDKLARIETEELQAAGISLPGSRTAGNLRRNRSESRLGQRDYEKNFSRPRQDFAVQEASEPSSHDAWDLRMPEEIADAEANAYFMSTGAGGTLIPVAKSSPVPLSLDFLERGSSALRRNLESFDDEPIPYNKTRSRSDSASLRDTDHSSSTGARSGKRSAANSSPKKQGAGARKGSGSSSRPTTRSGPNKDSPGSTGTAPTNRSARRPSRVRQPEGEPPWMANSYKPDPRLPPDQQLPGVVAKRLAQEQLEKDGAFGDAYDKDFRPLNNNSLLKQTDRAPPENQDEQVEEAWPLKPSVTTSPLIRQGSLYSTMPKISDKLPQSPMPSPPLRQTAQMATLQPQPQTDMQEMETSKDEAEKKRGGCGCCVVM